MVQLLQGLHYLWVTFKILYEYGTKMSFNTWLHVLVGLSALSGLCCIMHILQNLWKTFSAIILFAPKLYIKLVNYLMNFVEAPRHCQNDAHNHSRHSHRPTPTPTPTSSSERLNWFACLIFPWNRIKDINVIALVYCKLKSFLSLSFTCSSGDSDHDIPVRASVQSPSRHPRHPQRQTTRCRGCVQMVRQGKGWLAHHAGSGMQGDGCNT